MPTTILPPTPDGVAEAAAVLARGGLVAFPTETVYGLGADARDDAAIAALYAAKDRPRFNPLIAHVTGLAGARQVAQLGAAASALAERFWPGPLTLVVPRRQGGVGDLCAAGLSTVAVRAPSHPAATALLSAFGGPIAAPSANPSGKLSPTTAAHVLAGLDGRIDALIDGGPTSVGVESTILRVDDDGAATLLRPGGLPAEEIEAALGRPLASAPSSGAPVAPGMLESHYAPGARLRLGATAPAPGEAWLGFGADPALNGARATATLSPTGDLREAAAALFGALRMLDDELAGDGVIAVPTIPEIGLGRAINDRLRRAAAPRT